MSKFLLSLLGIGAVILCSFFLRFYQLAGDLPYHMLGATGAFLLDESAYQIGAAHRALFNTWFIPGMIYADWTIRGYQFWQFLFLNFFDVTLFSARLASIVAAILAQTALMLTIAKFIRLRVSLLFGILFATNFLMVMWTKMAIPYVATLLPISLLMVFSLLTILKKNTALAVLAGLTTFVAVTFKESSIFFTVVVFLFFWIACSEGDKFFCLKAIFNKYTIGYFLAFLVCYGAYHYYYLAPVENEYWNTSAEQSRGVITQLMSTISQPSLTTAHKHYTPLEAISKLLQKFFGVQFAFLVWMISLIGIATIIIKRKGLFKAKDAESLILIYMILWAVVIPSSFILFRFRSLIMHWIPIYLIPYLFFAAYSMDWLFQRRERVVRYLTIGMFATILTTDFIYYRGWIKAIPSETSLSTISQQLFETVSHSHDPRIVFVDSFFPFLRMPIYKIAYLRSFQLNHFDDVYNAVSPNFIALTAKNDRRDTSESVLLELKKSGYTTNYIRSFPLGTFDGSSAELNLFSLSKRQ